MLYAHLSEPPPRLTSRRQDLPAAVDDVLLRAMAKTPEDRYLTCGEFADDLRMASGLQRYDSDVAIALHQRTLTDQQRKLGLDHADALASRASLTAARQEASRSDEVIALHQRTLTDQRRALGPDHPDTLTTRFSIAEEMSARGEHTAAEGELRAVLGIREQMLGPEHPDTLATRFSIARRSRARGAHLGRGRVPIVLAARRRRWARITRTRWTPVQRRARCRRAAGMTRPKPSSARCWRRGSGRSAGITRTRWRPLFSVAQEISVRGITARRSTARRVFARGSGRSGRSLPTRWPPGSVSPRRWRLSGSLRRGRGGFWDVPARRADAGPDHPDRWRPRFQCRPEMAARGDHAGAEEQFRHVLAVGTRTLAPSTPTR